MFLMHSVESLMERGGINRNRPYREPRHTASTATATSIGARRTTKPGEISLAHDGVLFTNELPEFQRNLLEILSQTTKTAAFMVAHAKMPTSNIHVGSVISRILCKPAVGRHFTVRIILDRFQDHWWIVLIDASKYFPFPLRIWIFQSLATALPR